MAVGAFLFQKDMVGIGVPDGPTPTDKYSLSDVCFLRTVEDAGPYGFYFTLTD